MREGDNILRFVFFHSLPIFLSKKKTMKKEFITLDQVKERMQFEAYKPITLGKKIVGYTMIGIGIATLPLPTGSIFLIIGGCAILVIDYKRLLKTINFYGKETVYWVYRVWRLRWKH